MVSAFNELSAVSTWHKLLGTRQVCCALTAMALQVFQLRGNLRRAGLGIVLAGLRS